MEDLDGLAQTFLNIWPTETIKGLLYEATKVLGDLIYTIDNWNRIENVCEVFGR